MSAFPFNYSALIRPLLFISIALLVACGGGGGGGGEGSPASSDSPELDNIHPYVTSSAYSPILKDCTLAEDTASVCRLADLPLLIEGTSQPSVDEIMARVLVSHDWMGLRFRQVLETMPPEILQLFGAVTAIVIDDDTRPSYYYPATSAIFIDGAYLWLTNAEKVVISRDPDYRSEFDDELNFVSMARYVEGFSYAWPYYSLNGSEERILADIRLPLAELLLHELMHANDFFPAEYSVYLDQETTIYDAYRTLLPNRIAQQLRAAAPLQSELMFDLAAVMFQGAQASDSLKAVTAEEVGAAMEADAASDDYAYSSLAEDPAMLFSEAMMKYLFNIDRDVAYSSRPINDEDCDDYVIGWGMRGRIGDTDVKARAQLVVAAVYPGQDFSLFFQNLSAPKFMRVDESWCDNLAIF